MSPDKIIEGKNVEEAVKAASKKFGIEIDKLKFEVISYGSTGIFGLVGVKKAKIRVQNIDDSTVVKEGNREVKPATAKFKGLKKEKENKIESVINEDTATEESDFHKEYITREIDGENNVEKKVANLPEELKPYEKDPGELGKIVIEKIIENITSETKIDYQIKGDNVLYNISGGKAAVIIGKRGQTLEAIQYIIEKIVNRVSEKRIRVQIDVQDYLKNRSENLVELANRLAEKAQRLGKPVTAGEMNVHDRKIVHLALKDNKNVRTQSLGNGFYRKLMIFPKKTTERKKIKLAEKKTKSTEE